MVNTDDGDKSPLNRENLSKKQPETSDNGQETVNLFSPRFRSVALMAGWDEEALLLASLTVEDTPDRQFKHKKRRNSQNFRSPPSSSRRKRRAQKTSPESIPITVLDLDSEDVNPKQGGKKTKETDATVLVENKGGDDVDDEENGKCCSVSGSKPPILCIDRLREELSCAICLEICYEPSTTPCGHSFCKKCLRSAADKCGKRCPKCRQLISNGKYCTVNIVLWNTIQLLFPQEVEARKSAASSTSDSPPPQRESRRHNTRSRVVEALYSSSPEMKAQRDKKEEITL